MSEDLKDFIARCKTRKILCSHALVPYKSFRNCFLGPELFLRNS